MDFLYVLFGVGFGILLLTIGYYFGIDRGRTLYSLEGLLRQKEELEYQQKRLAEKITELTKEMQSGKTL